MTNKLTIEQIFKTFRNALDLDEKINLTPESAFEEVPGWDSLGHMRIIAELESDFDPVEPKHVCSAH